MSNNGWCTCPNCRGPSHVVEHTVHMNPQEFGIHTPDDNDDTQTDSSTQRPAALEANDDDDVHRRPPTDYETDDERMSVMPWWPVVGHEQTFHTNTRLADGRVSIIVDTGAWGNLSGDEWANTAARASKEAGHPPSQQRMAQPIQVQGVGHGSQECTWQTCIPVAMRLSDGRMTMNRFTSPTVPSSGLPALLGLRSLMEHGAVIDCRNKRLYLCGPGDCEITPPPGTEIVQMEQAPSGHLVIPISEYAAYERYISNINAAAPQPDQLALHGQDVVGGSSAPSVPNSSSSSSNLAAPIRDPPPTGQ